MTHGVGMTKSNIGSMIRAKGGATDRDAMSRAFAPREIEHVAHDYVFVRIVRAHPIGWINRLIVKTLQIDGVRAINRHSTGIDIAAYRSDQAKILVLVITAKGSRKENQRETAPVAKRKHFKFAVQPRRVPFDVTFVH